MKAIYLNLSTKIKNLILRITHKIWFPVIQRLLLNLYQKNIIGSQALHELISYFQDNNKEWLFDIYCFDRPETNPYYFKNAKK
ncbi:MAG: hypothetical protein ACRDBG_08320 [Waterburya sp.]